MRRSGAVLGSESAGRLLNMGGVRTRLLKMGNDLELGVRYRPCRNKTSYIYP